MFKQMIWNAFGIFQNNYILVNQIHSLKSGNAKFIKEFEWSVSWAAEIILV